MSSFKFVCALGITPRDLRMILRNLQETGETRNPFENVLITPLFTNPGTLRLIRELKEQGIVKSVYFDSGGYQIQKGNINYYSLYNRLLDFYIRNRWADYYVLPDVPPVSLDSPEEVRAKVRLTVEGTRRFFWELPSELQRKVICVVQGRDLDQIHYCLLNYERMGIRQIGFGSFATRGVDSSINILDEVSINNLIFMQRRYPFFKIHAFGVGNPPTAYVLRRVGISSFDSSGWIKAAGYGNIYFPFTRAYNVSFRRIERGDGALNQERFLILKELTNHECPFCRDFYKLSRNRDYRLIHNVLCMVDTVNSIDNHHQADHIISDWSPTYSKFLPKIKGAV